MYDVGDIMVMLVCVTLCIGLAINTDYVKDTRASRDRGETESDLRGKRREY